MSTPVVPPRPARANASGPTAVRENMPHIPPRPTRKMDPSPAREEYTRSPLNDLPDALGKPPKRRSVDAAAAASYASDDTPRRPPSVSLPMVGQEGSEYSSYDQLPPEARAPSSGSSAIPEQTRNVGGDVPLHAPKASFAQSTAKNRIATVTRMDSTQAAAVGIGKAKPEDDVHRSPADSTTNLSRVPTRTDDTLKRVSSTEPHPLRQTSSFNQSSTSLPAHTPGPGSISESAHEIGIPEIGVQIPLYPNAGDVQAPSFGHPQSQFAPGVGFFNDGTSRHHQRRKSSRQEFGPPGSYGLHGHHQEPQDKLERDWVAKHPKEAATEGYSVYGNLNMPRPQTALSTDELNKLVKVGDETGRATRPTAVSIPSWEIANSATEEYTSKYSSPMASPASNKPAHNRPVPTGDRAPSLAPKGISRVVDGGNGGEIVQVNEDGTIHIDPPERRANHITGGGSADAALDFGARAGNTSERGGWHDEHGDGTPILASDEVTKRPGSAFMHPAVSPEMKPSEDFFESDHGHDSRRSSLQIPSRPSSRPNSVHGNYHGGNLHRFISHDDHHGSGMHTPLEEIEEYEPLFPEDDDAGEKPKPQAFKKRPGLEHHHFPSQDVWEDTPSSLQYQTTVETPEPSVENQTARVPPAASSSSTFETPEDELRRRAQNPDNVLSGTQAIAKPPFKPGVQHDLEERPGMQRFPSSDIWEDTPDSMRLVTTVGGPQMEEIKSPPSDQPAAAQDDASSRATSGVTPLTRPNVPARPARKSRLAEELKPESVDKNESAADKDVSERSVPAARSATPPTVSVRPKPMVPARPARIQLQQQQRAPTDQTEPQVVAAAKSKPAVPARPGNDKFAALKAGFMSDLNNRLKLGPQGPSPPNAKEPEAAATEDLEVPKAPLSDARKGRAKGPARRKPASSPSSTGAVESEVKAQPHFAISPLTTVWHIDEAEGLHVPGQGEKEAEGVEGQRQAFEKQLSVNTVENTTEPTLAPPSESHATVAGREEKEALSDAPKALDQALESKAEGAEVPPAPVVTDAETPRTPPAGDAMFHAEDMHEAEIVGKQGTPSPAAAGASAGHSAAIAAPSEEVPPPTPLPGDMVIDAEKEDQ